MDASAAGEIQETIKWARESTRSHFYANKWGNETEFKRLPAVRRDDFLATPLSQRRYKDEKALVKVVRTKRGLFASEWAFADSAKEQWGPIGLRPMVYLADPDEAVEKSMWCYEQNRLPLIAEQMPELAQGSARFYHIDSLIVDTSTLPKLTPYLNERTEPLEYLSIIGPAFDSRVLLPYLQYAKEVHLVASLPETGAFAHAPLREHSRFTPLPDCHMEKHEGDLLLTRTVRLVTPIIRYALPSEYNEVAWSQ